jgi:hypothetical protein
MRLLRERETMLAVIDACIIIKRHTTTIRSSVPIWAFEPRPGWFDADHVGQSELVGMTYGSFPSLTRVWRDDMRRRQ